MNALGEINGLLTVDYLSSACIFTILQDPRTGKLISFLVDDGNEISEYSYSKPGFNTMPGAEPLQWGLLA